jgi:glyoxylase-like metal-dependent hydrolase (beta-lactamase superfamily II)
LDAVKAKAHAMPDRTYKDKLTMMSGQDQIDLYHFGRAHTNGDTFVVFPQLRAMHAGDAFPGKQLPFMDVANGGSGVAFPETVKKLTSTVRNVDTVITGHSPTVMKWQDLVEYGEFLQAFLDAARTSMKAGKTPEQAAAEIKLPSRFSGYTIPTSGFAAAPAAIKTIYGELGAK